MNRANKDAVESGTVQISIDRDLGGLLSRLEALSLEPGFRAQREIALARALRPYLEYAQQLPVTTFPEEIELANLYLYADFFPEDGQLDLIEQLRDIIEVHIPEEEREWLDPLHHSYMDFLDIRSIPAGDPAGTLDLKSLGDGREFRVAAGQFSWQLTQGEVLLARLIRKGERVAFAGSAIVLSASHARAILDAVNNWRREMEASTGSFALGEWEEFAKRHGYVLLWQVAQARVGSLLAEEAEVRFVSPLGTLFLYALALYEHHEPERLAQGLLTLSGFAADAITAGQATARRWAQQEDGATVVRLTLTPTQLLVECDSAQRLDRVKHQLAGTFGYSLHFRGETTAKPLHNWAWREVNLRQDKTAHRTIHVTEAEEQRLLGAFLESIYMEWADQPAPGLNGQIPRHVAGTAEGRARVSALLEEMARADLGLTRTGTPAFDYDRLRAHVGLY